MPNLVLTIFIYDALGRIGINFISPSQSFHKHIHEKKTNKKERKKGTSTREGKHSSEAQPSSSLCIRRYIVLSLEAQQKKQIYRPKKKQEGKTSIETMILWNRISNMYSSGGLFLVTLACAFVRITSSVPEHQHVFSSKLEVTVCIA